MKQASRLQFIDLARSIAILLMLQGHFISSTLEPYFEWKKILVETGSSDSLIFDYWVKLRGLTAPLFFFVSGLIVSYLLHQERFQSIPILKHPRVIKGLKRGALLMLIGYLLQFNVSNVSYYLRGNMNERLFAFHVLNSIGLSLILLMLLYALYRLIKRIPLPIVYFLSGLLILSIYPFLFQVDGFFPGDAPVIIQNIIKGPQSVFPIIPWSAYVLFGAACGAFFQEHQKLVNQPNFPFYFVFAAGGIAMCLRYLFSLIDFIMPDNYAFGESGYRFQILAIIILLIGVLMLLEKKRIPQKWLFMQMGQYTLSIYIAHIIILYGSITGIGIKTYLGHQLSMTEAIIGAVLFILVLAFYTRMHIHFDEWRTKRKQVSK